jgi:ribonucleoside-diphosphate reductase alpha chain
MNKTKKEYSGKTSRKSYLQINSYFVKPNQDPFDLFEWGRSNVQIIDGKSKEVIFKQDNVEFPEQYSPLARQVVSSKYFYGEQGTSERESSLKTLVGRVTETIAQWGLEEGYFDKKNAETFKKDLAYLSTAQKTSFNSPVWFNLGTNRYDSTKSSEQKDSYILRNGEVIKVPIGEDHNYPQTSACFIQSVQDNMESIMELARSEAMLFKHGSGTGTDLSTLRSSKEKLSGGGKPSGPMSFLSIYNKIAQVVKSGGKTRRAAKMQSLGVWHPDIKEFIEAKKDEEMKARALVREGYTPEEAAKTVDYQNANFSVRLTDEFMHAVEQDLEWQTSPVHNSYMKEQMPKFKARDLLKLIAETAWDCGDPGVQYDTTINQWHTCPKSGRINASNPCSEYMFIDDSACNLASLRLQKFRKADGSFDVEEYEEAVRLTFIAQEILISRSSYPTPKIAENANKFRPIGLGYADFGSFVMQEGLPYDSDEARAINGVLTALTNGKAFETSTELAKIKGPFEGFKENRKEMLSVIKMYRENLDKIDVSKLTPEMKKVYNRTLQIYENAINNGERYGFRNSQATVIAPTGTISFMMDCDTLGIEPDAALIKYKQLAGGGLLKIVNETIDPALRKLGYDEEERKRIIDYVHANETIEGSELKAEHLPVFDCSLVPKNGKRSIPWKAHVSMMAAAQPFLSGAISKTVNMPYESTAEDIAGAYLEGWKLGLKALAIYRDGSKVDQPLSSGKKQGLENKLAIPTPIRRRLPDTRPSITHKFEIGEGHEGYITVGLYPEDKKPGEVFITMAKEGSFISGMMDLFGTAVSMALQYGVPLETFVEKFAGSKFEPNGFVRKGDRANIKMAKSVPDYIFRWMGHQFIQEYGKDNGLSIDDENNHGKLAKPNDTNPERLSVQEPRPKGKKLDGICVRCHNPGHLYSLDSKNCTIFCDPDFGGCGLVNKLGCTE